MIDPILKFIHMPGQELIADWRMPENTYVIGDSVRMHPFIIAQMIASIEGTDAGLDLLQKYIHEFIDMKFEKLKNDLLSKSIDSYHDEINIQRHLSCNH